MARWVGAQGQVNSSKKLRNHAPIMTPPEENSNPKKKKTFLNLN